LYKGLSGIKGVKVLSTAGSPVVHVAIDPPLASRTDEINLIMQIAKKCVSRGYGVVAPKFPVIYDGSLRPTLRVCASALLTAKQIKEAVAEIGAAVSSSTKYQLRG
jgi:7-keto-8-aminopelargonate synthetase-like enzyme